VVISVVSGKGGAGKTTLATSLAHVLEAEFYDLDVDAPNSEYFLQPQFNKERIICQPIPIFDEALCNACGRCTKECRFNALVKIVDQIYLTESLCHGCGLCEKVCPQQAIHYQDSAVGKVRSGYSERLKNDAHIGDLKIGSARGTYLIEKLVKQIDPESINVIDGSPGNSCSAVAAIKPADLVVLVVEPTPFGFHDMQQTEAILNEMSKEYLIVANKVMTEKNVEDFFRDRPKKCALMIPLDERYLKVSLDGDILSRRFSEIHSALKNAIEQEIKDL